MPSLNEDLILVSWSPYSLINRSDLTQLDSIYHAIRSEESIYGASSKNEDLERVIFRVDETRADAGRFLATSLLSSERNTRVEGSTTNLHNYAVLGEDADFATLTASSLSVDGHAAATQTWVNGLLSSFEPTLSNVSNNYVPYKTANGIVNSPIYRRSDGQWASTETIIFPPGTLRAGDGAIRAGGRILSAKSVSTGKEGAFIIQLFDTDGFAPATVFDPTQVLTLYNLQTAQDSVSSQNFELNIRYIAQASSVFRYIDFKPENGTLPDMFHLTISLNNATNDPIFDADIPSDSPDLTDLGGGIFRFRLDNPAGLDPNFNTFINIRGIALLGGNGFTESPLIGDPTRNNFFPWLRVMNIPTVRCEIMHEANVVNYINNREGDDRLSFNSLKDVPGDNNVGFIDRTNDITIVSSISAINQFQMRASYTDTITISVEDELPDYDYLIIYNTDGEEIGYMNIDSINQVTDPNLNVEVRIYNLVGTIWKGRYNKSTSGPISFGNVNDVLTLAFLTQREVSAIAENFSKDEKEKLARLSTSAQVNDPRTFINAVGLANEIRFDKLDGTNQFVDISPYNRIYRNIGQSVPHGHITLDTISAAWIHLHADAGNADSITIPSNTDLNNDKLFVIDAREVDSDITVNVQKDFTRFQDDSTTITLRARHVLYCFVHAQFPSSPFSNSNILYIYYFQVPTDEFIDNYPDLAGTIVLASNGDDTNDGRTMPKAVATLNRAMIAVRDLGVTHKQIWSEDVYNFGHFTNTADTNNVPNLIVTGTGISFINITTADIVSYLFVRRVTGNIVLSSGSELVTGIIGVLSGDGNTIGFTHEVHTNTKLKADEVRALSVLSFSGVASGSKIRVEIDNYGADVQDVLDTIPLGVEVTGWIGNINLDMNKGFIFRNGDNPLYDTAWAKASGNPAEDTNEKLVFDAMFTTAKNLRLLINDTNVHSSSVTPIDGIQELHFTISTANWNTIYGSTPSSLVYQWQYERDTNSWTTFYKYTTVS